MNKDELIDAIVQIEWPMFAGVNNEGGKAACQMDLATFRIMRISQYSAWGEELLESCLADLRAAQNQGRNLMTEKYARMMKTTFPAVNGGSNPPGDAKNFNRLQQLSFWVTKIGLQFFLRRPSLEEFLF